MLIEIVERNFDQGDEAANKRARAYAQKKIGALEKFIPRDARGVATAQITLERDPNGREANGAVCGVVLTLPNAKLVCSDGTVNIFAAIDIAEGKLKDQIREYKERHSPKQSRIRSMMSWRAKRRRARVEAEERAEGE